MKQLMYVSLMMLFFCQCGQSPSAISVTNNSTSGDSFVQQISLSVDGNKKKFTPEDIFTLNYLADSKLKALALMSEKQNLQLTITTYLPALQPGSYQVYDCKGPTGCSPELEDKKQSVLFAPFPKSPMPAVTTSRIAYNAPLLGLAPLTLVITAITNEQQAGVPWKTNRIKGQFTATLAYVEKPVQDWIIIGQKTNVEGEFDLYCSIR